MELKFMIQWISSSISPSVANVIFCPFDKGDWMKKVSFFALVEKYEGKASVGSVLHALTEDPGYMEASTTIEYLLTKAAWNQRPNVARRVQKRKTRGGW